MKGLKKVYDRLEFEEPLRSKQIATGLLGALKFL